MEDIFADIKEAGEKAEEEKIIDLGPVSRLADKQAMLEAKSSQERVDRINRLVEELEASVDDLEEALKKRKKDLFRVRQEQIPELMKEFGLDSLTTTSGTKLSIKDGISVTVKNSGGLFKYLRENAAGDLIKNQIIVEVSDENERKEVVELLEKTKHAFEAKEAVHPGTLKKYIKGLRAEGKNVPGNIVNIFEYQFSKIKN